VKFLDTFVEVCGVIPKASEPSRADGAGSESVYSSSSRSKRVFTGLATAPAHQIPSTARMYDGSPLMTASQSLVHRSGERWESRPVEYLGVTSDILREIIRV